MANNRQTVDSSDQVTRMLKASVQFAYLDMQKKCTVSCALIHMGTYSWRCNIMELCGGTSPLSALALAFL